MPVPHTDRISDARGATLAKRLQLSPMPVHLDVRPFGGNVWSDPSQPPAPGSAKLVVRFDTAQIVLSYFDPSAGGDDDAPCPQCLDRRMLSTRGADEQWAAQCGHERHGGETPYLLSTHLDSLAALAEHVCRPETSGAHAVYCYDLVTQEITRYGLLGDAFCVGCAKVPVVGAQPAALELRPDLQARSGKSRMCSLLDYQLPMSALLNPVCGVAGTGSVRGYAQSITSPVFSQYEQRAFWGRSRRVGWSGLCLRTDESRVAGVLEALERQGGMLVRPETTAAFGSYRDLAERAIDPASLLAYDEATHASTDITRYHPDLPIEWTWGWSLTRGCEVLVPQQLVFYDRVDTAQRVKIVDNNSSGCALGSCYEEAVLKAMCELIERDSFVLAWYRQLSLPAIDRHGDRCIGSLLRRIAHLGFRMTLLDGRFDLQVPTVIAIARRTDDAKGAMAVGAATAIDPEDALRSALLEAATSIVEMPVMYDSARTRVDKLALDYSQVRTVRDHSLLYALPEMAAQTRWMDAAPSVRSFAEAYPAERTYRSSGHITQDIAHVLAELSRCGMSEVVAVDLTTREQRALGLKTVRMVVPGLAPIDFGHPRCRARGVPRFRSAPAAAGFGLQGVDTPPALPHPFP